MGRQENVLKLVEDAKTKVRLNLNSLLKPFFSLKSKFAIEAKCGKRSEQPRYLS
jgi:hypothetical protein